MNINKSWFKCLKCDETNKDKLTDEDDILLNALRRADAIKDLLDSDESGYLQVSLMGIETMEPIDFLMEHYGKGHDVIV